MGRTLVLVSAFALLAACQQHEPPMTSGGGPRGAAPGPHSTSAPAETTSAGQIPGNATPATSAAQPSGDASRSEASPAGEVALPRTTAPTAPDIPLLAFDFRYQLALPSAQVRPLMDAHQEACERAGPTQCQVAGVASRDDERGLASGTLTLRATPTWLRAFRGRVEADVHDAGGRVVNAGTQGQDMAPVLQQTADSGNALSLQREELQRRIRREGDPDGVLQEQLNEIDAQIAQARAQHTDAQTRIAMSTVVLDYRASGLIPATGDGAPLAEAFRHFWSTSAVVAAVIVNVAAVLLPFAMIGAPVWWLVMRSRRRPEPRRARPMAHAREEVSPGS
jgi:hypothetical protein